MLFNGHMFPRVYFTTPNIQNDLNLTITIIHHMITHWHGNLTQFLYLWLNNTQYENKNQIVFGYLSMLVELINFQNVKLGFLLIVHMHAHIDQMFICFVVELKRKNTGSLLSLISIIKKSYFLEPIFHALENIVDMCRFINRLHDEEKCIRQINNINLSLIFYKKYWWECWQYGNIGWDWWKMR